MWYFGDTRNEPIDSLSPPVAELFRAAAHRLGTLIRAFSGRRVLSDLSRLDDRMLRDIGLTRSDLRDAASLPSLSDLTALLFDRMRERRMRRSAPDGRRFLSDV